MGLIRREALADKQMFSFARFEDQARELIARAEARAKRIVDESEGHIREVTEAHKHEGYEAGLTEGRQAGFEQARADGRQVAIEEAKTELLQLTQALNQTLAEFECQRRSLLGLAETGLIELAMAIARRVCKIAVNSSTEPVRANLRALLGMVKHQHDLEIHLHPAEHELLPIELPEFADAAAGLGHVELVADPNVPRGGCLLQTRDGTIDASIEGQLDRVAEILCEGLTSPTPPAADDEVTP
jgi:flagellar assembly protein FliH